MSSLHCNADQLRRRLASLIKKVGELAPLIAVECRQCIAGVCRPNSLAGGRHARLRRSSTTTFHPAINGSNAHPLHNNLQLHHPHLRSKLLQQLAALRFKKLADNAKETTTKRQRLGPNPSPAVEAKFAVRLQPGNHLPSASAGRLRCKLCYSRRVTNKTHVFCSVCNVHLCLRPGRNCFLEWHTAAHL